MAENNKVAYVGYAEVVPYNKGRNQSESSDTRTFRVAHKDENYKCSGRYTETHKAGEFANKSGKVGYKEESRYTSTVKYDDKVEGSTTEYQTKVNVKKVVYPSTSKTSSSSKHINYY